MTIFFVTVEYGDDGQAEKATEANHFIAQQMHHGEDIALFAADATRVNLHAQLQNGMFHQAVFSMSHGSEQSIKDSNKVVALNSEDAQTISNSKIFAWACNTAKLLGSKFADNGNIWWGYAALITAPTQTEPFASLIGEILYDLKQAFASANDVRGIREILQDVKEKCDHAEDQVLQLDEVDTLDLMTVLSTLRQIWQYLHVWLPDHEQPVCHPEAMPVSIFR